MAAAAGGNVRLAKGLGYVVKVRFKKDRDIVVRIMDEGGGRSNYYHLPVASEASYSVTGETTNDAALTHIPITRASFEEIMNVAVQIQQGK